MYIHELTETEIACHVTLEDVQRELVRGLFFDGGKAFAVANDVSPAIAGSVARAAFAGPATFVGVNTFGQLVYRAETAK